MVTDTKLQRPNDTVYCGLLMAIIGVARLILTDEQ